MRRTLRGRRGLSEIVGALMLVLIVVAAATSLSLFVASYQKQLQKQQQVLQQRGLESLRLLKLAPDLNRTTNAWSLLNFTLASLYINPSTISSISINDHPLKQYSAWRLDLSSGNFQSNTVLAGGQLSLTAREQLNIIVNLSAGPSFSFYDSTFVLHANSYVKVDLFTTLGNDFSRLFIPPTAIALVTTLQSWNGTAYVTVPVMDGSSSFQPGNATLVSWSWNITPDNTVATGEKAVATFTQSNINHTITLTVTNSDGLIATSAIVYHR
jgi:flagellin-like protein